ncbi:tigger transposable element-derived protein 4-like [Uloborus diversus]|uniref:tigger transposable element-derived protein 4-like n=1 Tax=Uloborus diversus TaxID=327109 RepID=UPI00240A6C94|nr:tigger transposable element-derived protein 4-like [Uloborus diversus]
MQNVWPDIIRDYDKKDIFNADEAGLFYKLTPNQTLKLKGEKCVGGKHSNIRITILVCANMTGSEKQKLMVIGKSNKPRCFKNVKKLPVVYKSNKKSWMTADLFQESLQQWDKELSQGKRKIVVLIDNCSAHVELRNLQWIKVVFLPPNTTSVMQPMDQGVIRSLKCHYRKQLILRILECYDNNKDCDISLLDAIVLVEKSWRMVSDSTIRNCFRHAGLRKMQQDEDKGYDEDDDDDNLPISKWLEKHGVHVFPQSEIEHFESCDHDVATSGEVSDSDIVSEVSERMNLTSDMDDNFSDNDEGTEDANPGPSISAAKAAVRGLSRIFHRVRFL